MKKTQKRSICLLLAGCLFLGGLPALPLSVRADRGYSGYGRAVSAMFLEDANDAIDENTIPTDGTADMNQLLTELGFRAADTLPAEAEAAYDNTWLFAGGVETQGRFEEIGGARSYIGSFEEYIRFQMCRGGTNGTRGEFNNLLSVKHRFCFNAGKEGQDLSAFVARMDELAAKTDPRAISYLIGPEDYRQGIAGLEDFQNALSQFISKALAIRPEGKSYAVVQLPHAVNDTDQMANIYLYIDAADQVLAGLSADQKDRVAVVDHFTKTDNDAFLTGGNLNENGILTKQGHDLLARQFAQAMTDLGALYPSEKLARFAPVINWQESQDLGDTPLRSLHVAPTAVAGADSLTVTVPESVKGSRFSYALRIGGATRTGEAASRTFTIPSLPEEAAYELTVTAENGSSQLDTVAGEIITGDVSGEPVRKLTAAQQKIQEKIQGDDPLTWLFIGDSITHACLYTYGYDGIAQIFDKYVREDLGREDDLVLNTGISSATTATARLTLKYRLEKYAPDILTIMLGTNDSNTNATLHVSVEDYEANLRYFIRRARELNPNVSIVLRTPSPTTFTPVQPAQYRSIMKKIADEDDGIILIDQHTDWQAEIDAYPYLLGRVGYDYGNNYDFGSSQPGSSANALHPGAPGQLRMAQYLAAGMGLPTNTPVISHAYLSSYETAQTSTDISSAVTTESGQVTIDKANLQSACQSGTIVQIKAGLKSDDAVFTAEAGLSDAACVFHGVPSGSYTLTVTANLKGNTAKKAVFTTNVTVTNEAPGHVLISSTKAASNRAGSQVGTLSSDFQADTFSLCEGRGSENNDSFVIQGSALAVRTALTPGTVYSVRIRGVRKDQSFESILRITAGEAAAETEEARNSLQAELNRIKRILDAGNTLYTPDSWARLQDAYTKAAQMLAGGTASASALRTLEAQLTQTASSLELRPIMPIPNPSDPVKPSKPGKATLLALKNLKGRKVQLRWKKVKKADGYELFRSEKKKGKYKKIATIKKGSTVKYLNKKLKKGRTYYFKMKAYRKAGGRKIYGNWSAVKKIKIQK